MKRLERIEKTKTKTEKGIVCLVCSTEGTEEEMGKKDK